MVAQDNFVSTLVTTSTIGSSSFSLPPWLGMITQKRKKEELLPNDHDFRKVANTKASKSKKAKMVLRIVIGNDEVKYVEIVDPLIGKPTYEIQ